MRLKSTLWIPAVCLLAGLLMTAGAGRAENPGGKFTLPFATTWGTTVLPPGDYTFTVLSSFGSVRYLDVRGKTASVFILAAENTTEADAGKSSLTMLAVGENHFVEKLTLKEAGLTFHFRLPKSARIPARFANLMTKTGQGS